MGLTLFIWHNRKAVLLLVALLCAMGAFFYRTLPVAIFPDLTAPRIIVTADAGDTPIPALLAKITRPLEGAVAGVPGITKLGSLTQQGSAELDVNFQPGTDMLVTLQKVESKISAIQNDLPPGTQVAAERLNPAVFPVMGYSLYSKTVSAKELHRIALYTVRPRLLRVTDVQQISVLGGDTPNFTVTLNPTAMQSRGVTISDVTDALSKNNVIASAGYYDKSFLHYQILVSGLLRGSADINNIAVAVKNRIPVTLNQIATVTNGVEPQTIATSGDGHNAVLVNVIKQPAGNTIQVADGIDAALHELEATLPPGVTISTFYDQSQIVHESQNSVVEAIIIGGVLAMLVVVLFLGNLRTASVVLIALPLTVSITFALMKVLGQTLNIMTLGALAVALGLVIDDSIVVVENIYHELESGLSRRAAIASGLALVTPAMIGSSITTMAAFAPLLFLTGITGEFFGPLSLVMLMTLAVSLGLALVLVPLLAGWLLPEKAEHPSGIAGKILGFVPHLFDLLANVYGRVLGWCLGHRWVVIVALLPLGFATYSLYGRLQTGFFPEFDEGGFILDYQTPAGTSLAQTDSDALKVERILAATPEVAAWSRRTGAQLGFDITTINSGDISVRLKTDRSRGIDAVMDDIRTRVEAQVPSVAADFHQILQDQIGDIAGSPSPVQIKIFGDDEAQLEKLASQVNDLIAKVPGVVDNNNGIVNSSPQAIVRVDTARAQRFGFATDDIQTAAQTALIGSVPTNIQQGEQTIGVRVRVAPPPGGVDASTLPAIPLPSPVTGTTVPLNQVANINVEPGTPQITREDQRQMIAVTASLSGRDLGSATQEIQNVIQKQVKLPNGYSIEYGGLYASQQDSFGQLGAVMLVSLLLVFALLVLQLRSLRQSIALLLAAILSMSGVLAALYLTKTQLNISSITGAVMIIGIITENGIVLFDFFNRLRRENSDKPILDLMKQACRERLRPIVMTTIGAILALFPLSLGLGAGAALQKPLAIAVIGGLTVSTIFTLLVAPTLFLALESWKPSRAQTEENKEFEAVQRELETAH